MKSAELAISHLIRKGLRRLVYTHTNFARRLDFCDRVIGLRVSESAEKRDGYRSSPLSFHIRHPFVMQLILSIEVITIILGKTLMIKKRFVFPISALG